VPNDPSLGGNYGLGFTNPPTLFEALGIPDPFPGEIQPFAEVGGNAGSNRQIRLGLPVAKWTWGMLDQRQFNYLMTFVSGHDPDVFIKTRVASGTVMTYNTFRAVMHYPTKATPVAGGLWRDVEVIFTELINA
jgi:hypothetical protein